MQSVHWNELAGHSGLKVCQASCHKDTTPCKGTSALALCSETHLLLDCSVPPSQLRKGIAKCLLSHVLMCYVRGHQSCSLQAQQQQPLPRLSTSRIPRSCSCSTLRGSQRQLLPWGATHCW